MILYNRKKVKYRKDGYCWKKRKDGKTTREDHMKLKVQGVEVRAATQSRRSLCLPSERVVPSSPPHLPPHAPISLLLPLSLALPLKDKSVFGPRPGMMSMPPSAEQRGVSIQSQGSVCACVRACVVARVPARTWRVDSRLKKIDYSAGMHVER